RLVCRPYGDGPAVPTVAGGNCSSRSEDVRGKLGNCVTRDNFRFTLNCSSRSEDVRGKLGNCVTRAVTNDGRKHRRTSNAWGPPPRPEGARQLGELPRHEEPSGG